MLDKYIEEIKEYLSKIEDISDELIIRYVYIDLGKRLSFDTNYIPFGNSKKRQAIYREGNRLENLNNCMETNTIICNSLSNILTYVLQGLGINIKTIIDPNDDRKMRHTYNLIIPKDKDKYTIDLQEDLYRIQMHGFTQNFGLSYDNPNTYVISNFEQEKIDRKIGYINDNDYYTDDYIYTLKFDLSFFENFKEKVRFILENIEIYEKTDMSYIDRQWYHVKVLENFFDKKEFDYRNNYGKIRFIDCYKMINENKQYINVVVVDDSSLEPEIYIYNNKEKKYSRIDFINFAYAVKNGVVLMNNSKIRNLDKVMKKIK